MKMSFRLLPVFLVCSVAVQCQNPAPKPKNIILLIGDGMGTAQIFAGLTANKGKLNLERCSVVGFHKNQSADNYVTDSGAGATALSIGKKARNGAIGVDATSVAHPTILEIAERNKLSTGMVVTCSITHATPASFIAHVPSRSSVENIALDFLETDIDVFIGGGRNHFAKRKDGLNLLDSLRQRNYQVLDSFPGIATVNSGKLAAFIADEEPPKASEGRAGQLLTGTKTALNILSKNKAGFFLMVEGSQIDWGSHANNTQYVIDEMIDFDEVIGEVLDFAAKDKNTLVIITADHETGGMTLNGGDMKTGRVDAKFTTTHHTGVMIPVFAFGPGSEKFSGIYENTAIFTKMLEALKLSVK